MSFKPYYDELVTVVTILITNDELLVSTRIYITRHSMDFYFICLITLSATAAIFAILPEYYNKILYTKQIPHIEKTFLEAQLIAINVFPSVFCKRNIVFSALIRF